MRGHIKLISGETPSFPQTYTGILFDLQEFNTPVFFRYICFGSKRQKEKDILGLWVLSLLRQMLFGKLYYLFRQNQTKTLTKLYTHVHYHKLCNK